MAALIRPIGRGESFGGFSPHLPPASPPPVLRGHRWDDAAPSNNAEANRCGGSLLGCTWLVGDHSCARPLEARRMITLTGPFQKTLASPRADGLVAPTDRALRGGRSEPRPSRPVHRRRPTGHLRGAHCHDRCIAGGLLVT
eukprot:6077859-Pyramimonas_sp.AAC.1